MFKLTVQMVRVTIRNKLINNENKRQLIHKRTSNSKLRIERIICNHRLRGRSSNRISPNTKRKSNHSNNRIQMIETIGI